MHLMQNSHFRLQNRMLYLQEILPWQWYISWSDSVWWLQGVRWNYASCNRTFQVPIHCYCNSVFITVIENTESHVPLWYKIFIVFYLSLHNIQMLSLCSFKQICTVTNFDSTYSGVINLLPCGNFFFLRCTLFSS